MSIDGVFGFLCIRIAFFLVKCIYDFIKHAIRWCILNWCRMGVFGCFWIKFWGWGWIQPEMLLDGVFWCLYMNFNE